MLLGQPAHYPSKMVDSLTTLFAKHPGIKLLLVGDFEDGDPVHPSVREQIEADPAVICTGMVEDHAEHEQRQQNGADEERLGSNPFQIFAAENQSDITHDDCPPHR